jgi:hypothetical protein
MEYAVMAETHEGKTMTLRRGFRSEEDAEDHPVQMSLWKRVWVAPVPGTEKPIPAEATLPPRPWDWIAAGTADASGTFHAYLVDATGRKLGAIWGRRGEKQLIADHIIESVNARAGGGNDC